MTPTLNSTIIGVLLLLAVPSFAQFKGGDGNGSTVAVHLNSALGRNIFIGGNDDGINLSIASNQPIGRNIFTGGNDDGITVGLSANQEMGRNIFKGGNDDGFTTNLASSQATGRNIFKGGNDDGINVAIASNQPLGRNIFTGGANDGWALGIPGVNAALPVTLVDFAGKWQNDDAFLSWKTATEINSSHFELERSFDGNNYSVVTTVTAAGQSNTLRSYSYTDARIKLLLPQNVTIVFYRLKSVDLDGTSRYSGIIVLKVTSSGLITYSIYPNPATDVIMIANNGNAGDKTTVILSDAGGHVLLQQQLNSNAQQINVGRFAAGTYFIQLIRNGKIEHTQKIIIQK